MKIGYILDIYPHSTQTFVSNEIVKLSEIGFDTSVYSIKKTSFPQNTNQPPTKYLPDIRISRYCLAVQIFKIFVSNPLGITKIFRFLKQHNTGLKFDLRNILILTQLVQADGIDHIHAHFASRAALYAMCVNFLTGIPYSITTHAYDIFLNPNMIEEKHKFAEFAVTISEYNRVYLKSMFGIDDTKVHVVRCAIPPDTIKKKKYKNSADDKLRILSVGRLVEKKGFEYLIKACRIYMDTVNKNIECVIAGGGPLNKLLLKLIEDLSLEKNVFILGEKKHRDVLDLLDHADIFVLPCVQAKNGDMDGIPVSLMEAMARGVITVSTKLSGIPELIDQDMLLAEPASELDLCKILKYTSMLDKEEKNRISSHQIKKIENDFNLNKETKKIAELFQQGKLL